MTAYGFLFSVPRGGTYLLINDSLRAPTLSHFLMALVIGTSLLDAELGCGWPALLRMAGLGDVRYSGPLWC